MNIIGKKCIVRSCDAGVFYGVVEEIDGQTVSMSNARCLWYWDGAASLNQLAVDGVNCPDNCKFTMYVNSLIILGVCEMIPCTEDAIKSIEGVKEWKM